MSSHEQIPFLEQLVAHIALPRKLPGREDGNLLRIEEAILTRFLKAAVSFTPHVSPDHLLHVNGLRETLLACAALNINGTIGQVALLREFHELDARKTLILYLAPQNCAVLIHAGHSDFGERQVVFEAFETSATSEKVLASPTALLWDFPGCAVSMPWTTFSTDPFQEALVTFLEQASTESVSRFAAVTRKASATIPEIRDTSDPALISGLLMAILEGNGIAESVPILRKRVRDSVTFDNARKPWRRSGFYLAIRVAVQRYFYRQLGPILGRMYYKIFVCLFLAEFLEEVLRRVPPETAHHLRQKLGRRLAKLESDANSSDMSTKMVYSDLMRALRSYFEGTLRSTGAFLKVRWQNHLRSCEPMLPTLRVRAHDTDFKLCLANSGSKLKSMKAFSASIPRTQTTSPATLLRAYEKSVATAKPYMRALSLHITTSQYLESVVIPAKHPASFPSDTRTVQLGKVIRDFVTRIHATGVDYPNQRSQMLLHLMELWILLDKDMVDAYPLLEDYHPGFDADILDPVQLLTAVDMQRAQNVRAYLTKRYRSRSDMTSKTIFDDPKDDSFSVQYYNRFDTEAELLGMRQEIEEIATKHREAKVHECKVESERHQKIIEQRNESECTHDTLSAYGLRKPCSWHQLNNEANKMRFRIFEEPLPNYEPAAKAVLFELICPEDFAAYRDATWKVLSMLCFQSSDGPDRISLMREYSQLQSYVNDTECVVTLGSYKKAHLESHYATCRFPIIRPEDILRTCGLRPRYYDSLGNMWTADHGKASFWHLFPVRLPADSPFHDLGLSYDKWPTSNEVQANQVNCPEGLSAHEFAAWQGLLVGTHSRWQDLLRELGSTNINFSSTSTCVIVLRLALQQGPASTGGDRYTDIHNALLDETLCAKLFGQIRYRLEAIQRNWREPVQMELLITVLLRVVALAPCRVTQNAGEDLLEFARQITSSWRTELQSIVTEDPKLYQSAIWASLLCKRTMHTQSSWFTPGSLRHFIDASIALQYNLTGAFLSMPNQVRSALVQDTVYAFEMRHELKHAILANPQILVDAIDALWQIPKDHDVLTKHVADTWWILVEVKSPNDQNIHYLHYNYIHGNLLINGKEMGTLPLEIRTHKDYGRLFGHRNPTVCPSPLQGMAFTLIETHKNGHRVHFGFHMGNLVIRVFHRNRILEYVPCETFGADPKSIDLPEPLIKDCFHWLDVHNGNVEVRRTDAWASKPANWWLICHQSGHYRAIRRPGDAREATLLEPLSDFAQNVLRIFQYFERSSQIMVYAATRNHGPVVVDLKRLELSFNINRDGLLESQRLGAIVTRSQDAGTWYGLKSKIVVQSIANRRHKSVLIPLGPIKIQKNEHHVVVEIERESGIYLRYGLNDTLGRVECPPEPRLLYTRALLHAYTSHFTPDRLTGRTGTEEALYLLQSGSYQPWQPLISKEIAILLHLAELSPQRGYYPKDLKCMETVVWKPELTVYMQDDRYLPLVLKILRRSSYLSKFSRIQQASQPSDLHTSNPHLARRSLSLANISTSKVDVGWYISRDSRRSGVSRTNVLMVIKQLLSWQPLSLEGSTLSSLLHDAHFVGGYDKYFQKVLLTDQIGVDIKAEWGALAQKALHCDIEDRFGLIFLFGTMAFSDDANLDLIRMLICFAMIPELRSLKPPQHPGYHHFRVDGAPPVSYLASFFDKSKMSFSEAGFRKRSQLIAAQATYEAGVQISCTLLAGSIRKQWPNTSIDHEKLCSIDLHHLDVARALADIEPEWERLTRNHELALYVEKVQEIIWRYSASPQRGVEQSRVKLEMNIVPRPGLRFPIRDKRHDDMVLSDLLQSPIQQQPSPVMLSTPAASAWAPRGALATKAVNVPVNSVGPLKVHNNIPTYHNAHRFNNANTTKKQSPEIQKLRSIVAGFKDSASFVQCRYAKELETSINALEQHLADSNEQTHAAYPRIGPVEIKAAKDRALGIASRVCDSLQAKYPQARWLQLVDLWPKMTIVELLCQLRTTSGTSFGKGANEVLVELGIAITQWQRLLRLQDAQKRGRFQQEQEEWVNDGHTNWDAVNFPDWLLLEIDGDHLLRKEQVEVALATMSPVSGQNSVLQLLMGKGKTSCILPMVAAMLANRTDLARIVVPRALLLQSAQVLQAKLGGLANRDILHIPFSRKTPTDQKLMRLYGKMQVQMRDHSGVMLALPEHILSFKLSGIQQLCDNRLEQASTMLKIQDWLDQHTRDVLDECDVSLAIKTQLIYPSGTQSTVDGHPMRWQVSQTLLHLVKDHVLAVQSRYPRSIEIVKRGIDGFPLVYFLRKDAEDYLLELMIMIICRGQTPSILPCAEYPPAVTAGIKAYISSPTVRTETISMVVSFLQDNPNLMRTVNLLRGIFVHRILIATLKKRWNVQYGLHPTRAPVAVPYLAKGVASPTAEWGHPDVAILLTCLSFYYQGVTRAQFKQAFEHLTKTDEPSVEYEKWFPKGLDIPNELEDFTAINAEDARQLQDLYLTVRANAFLVDFYLNNFVFPKYAKTFKLKLQASGWNLFPSLSIQDQGCRVTGFSGTNDSRHQLPMLVKQANLPQLAHTNAEVPFYLLAPRNSSYIRMAHASNGKRWTERDLLRQLANSVRHGHTTVNHTGRIRVLIDAGAQILEHSNEDFAKAWLEEDTEAIAAVFFDNDHRAWVLSRVGNKRVPLLASPFADNLDSCVVYLDEAHCRGTDLKLPVHARAALTLGQNLTKDAMVQASMRLRLLGQTQSITFFSPLEVHQGILDRLQEGQDYQPQSGDVLRWVFSQTCDAIEQLEPSFFSQTSQYMQQEQARAEHPNYLQNPQARQAFLEAVRTKESLSLKQLYEPKRHRGPGSTTTEWTGSLQGIATALQRRKDHFQDRGTAVHASALEEVEIEQEREAEREVESEVENVREVQQAVHLTALKIKDLHEDVEHFAIFGRMVAGSDAYKPMFAVLARTALGLKHGVNVSMKSKLWISAQFTRTVEAYMLTDNYLRTPQWVLWSSVSQNALLVSPEEANELIPLLRGRKARGADVNVYLISYSAPVTRRMLHFNKLDYYATPPLPADFEAPVWLTVELGIFSGRLYLEWHEYYGLLGYLGLDKNLSPLEDSQAFAKKPLTFLHEWLALRRKGQDFEHTPMGFVTTGKPLTENHPFFRSFAVSTDHDIRHQIARHISARGEEAVDGDDDGDQDDDDFMPVEEHVDDSEESSDEEVFVEALETAQ